MPPQDPSSRARKLEELARENVRALVERNRSDPGYDGPVVSPRRIGSVGIIGAGQMGTSIAAAHLRAGSPVKITDHDADVRAVAPQRVAAELTADMPADEAHRAVERLLVVVERESELADCDLVLESIVEAFASKRDLFERMERHWSRAALVASNTSTIPIGRLAAVLADPSRFCGLHFCHPVRQRPLVEVVRGPRTSDATVATAVAHAKALGKMPIVVADGPGFLVNRLLLPYLGEALELLLEGATVDQIEQAAEDFGFAKGPLRLLDEIGLDTTLHAGWVLAEAFPERIVASPLLVAMVKSGKLGRKSGAGFFFYADDLESDPVSAPVARRAGSRPGRHPVDPLVPELVAKWAKPSQPHTPHSIIMRMLLPMVLEASRLLEENKVRDSRDIDLAVIFGLGFPESKGGLLWWADSLSAARIVEMLRSMQSLGARAEPTHGLLAMARSHRRYYERPAAAR